MTRSFARSAVAIAIIAILFSFTQFAHAGTVKLDYIPPSTCADGSSIANCPPTGFEILTGTDTTGTYTSLETVGPSVTSRTYQNQAPGKRCYSVKTVSNTVKSDESTRACADVPSLPPKAPQDIQVTVVVTVSTP